jgi:hypothetical protein
MTGALGPTGVNGAEGAEGLAGPTGDVSWEAGGDQQLFVGGSFTSTPQYAFLYNDSGTTGLTPGAAVLGLAASSTHLAAATSSNVYLRTRAATSWTALGAAGVLQLLFVPPSDGFPQGRLIAGGDTISPFTRIGQYNLATSTWTTLGTGGANGAVLALALYNGEIVASGNFTSIGGVSTRVARWTGTTWVAMGTEIDAIARVLRVDQTGTLYIGGSFTNNLLRWNGTSWETLPNYTASGAVFALVFTRTNVLYAGLTTSPYLQRWDGNSTEDLSSAVSVAVYALELAPNGTHIVFGSISSPFLAIFDGYRATAFLSVSGFVQRIVQVPPIAPAESRRTLALEVGVATATPGAALDVSGNAVLDGTVTDAGFSGLLSATVANMAPRPGRSLVLAERFCRWMQYVTSRAWQEEVYVDQPAWWAQWMLSGRDGAATAALTWTTYSGVTTGSSIKFNGSVLLPDGRVLAVPRFSTTVGVFDYRTNTWASYSGHTGTLGGGCLLPDGRALMVPASSTDFYVFDYRNNAVTTVGAAGTLTEKYYTCTLLPNGQVYVPNRLATANAILFDYTTDAITTLAPIPAQTETSRVMPDGRVFLASNGSAVLRTYDYTTQALTTQTSLAVTNPTSTLLPDGRVLFAGSSGVSCTMDFRTNTSANNPYTISSAIGALSMLPDGRALAAMRISSGGTTIGAFDYRTDTWTTYNGPGNEYYSSKLLPDGRVVLIPGGATNNVAVVSVTGSTRAPSLDYCYHPSFDNSK